MALATYSDLKTSVANWLAKDNLTSIIPDLIVLGEKRLFRDLRVREMETALSGTIASGVMALPTGYLELKFAYIDGTPVQNLGKASATQIYAKYPLRASDSCPSVIGREGSNFIFGPFPDSGYTVKGIYYAKPTSVVTSPTFFAEYPDAFLFAALCEASAYIHNDPRIGVWEGKLKQVMAAINDQAKQEEGGSGMAVRAA